MNYLVKHTPIRKNGKTYQVGETFPYSDKDKSLLDKGYLEEAKDEQQVAKTNEQQVAKKKPAVIERSRNAVKKKK